MKAREEIVDVLKRMRTFAIVDVIQETYDLSKAQINWETTVRNYIRVLEKRGHVRKVGKTRRNGRLVTLYQSLVMYAPEEELKW
jgi:predicted transcriptional regulator